MHFQQLFAILKKLGDKWANACYHLSYGMVLLPEGKMKSREGKVVDADAIIEEMISLAKKEILKRHPELEHAVLENRARQVGLAALKFYLLKIDPVKDMVYHPEESIRFEGETGPYIQYTHARIASILRKYGKTLPEKVDLTFLNEREFIIASLLAQFPCIVEESAVQYKPSHLCRYLLDLAQESNSYYHDVPVLKADKNVQEARLYLIAAVKQVLQNGLELLGIEAPEEM
jgi:arginyl-tRNA synthetase